jgi:hypothetical protein
MAPISRRGAKCRNVWCSVCYGEWNTPDQKSGVIHAPRMSPSSHWGRRRERVTPLFHLYARHWQPKLTKQWSEIPWHLTRLSLRLGSGSSANQALWAAAVVLAVEEVRWWTGQSAEIGNVTFEVIDRSAIWIPARFSSFSLLASATVVWSQ